jgi:periplasmic protein TonB
MIISPKNLSAHLLSTWTAGVSVLFLGIGLQGSMAPLVSQPAAIFLPSDEGEEIMIEEFDPAAAALSEESQDAPPEEVEQAIEEEFEIPPLPEIAVPITPPEMEEIAPLETYIEPPPPAPKPTPKPKPQPTKSTPKPKAAASSSSSSSSGTSGPATVFTGSGRGRFPSPSYPTSARSAGLQGSVRLMVTVEASGLPSSVSVISSSGHSTLDSAARDHISRRWRWPSGSVRKYIVPIRFQLR